MIELPVYNREGKEIDRMQIEEAVLGGRIRAALLKQAIVMYHANKRQGTFGTKSRGMVAGSTAKMYKQKGTGNARMGPKRTPVRKGGGVAFAKMPREFRQSMPKKQRRLARNSAILSKMKTNNAVVVDKLEFNLPKTKEFATILNRLNISRTCVVAINEHDTNVYKSVRNIPGIHLLSVDQLNAGDICRCQKLLFTREALESLLNQNAPAESQA